MSALCDFGMFREPYFDQKRWDLIQENLVDHFKLTEDELAKVNGVHVGLRPLSPDSLPAIGPMQMFPNVVLNECYGAHGSMCLYGSRLASAVGEGETLDEELQSKVNPSRLFI